MKLPIALVLTFSLFLTNCATIVSKSSYPVTVNSNPQGMTFTVTDLKTGTIVSQGKTPQQVTLKSGAGYFEKGSYRIDVKKGGKTVASQTLTASMDGWFIGNILFGGVIGMLIVDPITGAMYKLPADVTVGSSVAVTESRAHRLHIVSIDSLDAGQRKQLVKI